MLTTAFSVLCRSSSFSLWIRLGPRALERVHVPGTVQCKLHAWIG
jgi:hypothetical protein